MSAGNQLTPPRLPIAETLTVEFKSDRKRLPDDELVETLVCLANTEGDLRIIADHCGSLRIIADVNR